jgi:methylmalonyl-CoA/ethylmalonyl-CoA epimerase
MSAHSETAMHVDHISIAVPSIDEALAFFRRHFPLEMGVPKQAGYVPEFNWCDFYLGSFKLELIESTRPASFVERFLAKRGPGLHHWSFEATGLTPHLDRLEHDGLRIVDRFEPGNGFSTAFISPRSAFGVLIQFWQVPALENLARPRTVPLRLRSGETVHLRVDHVSIAVADIEAALAFFERYFPFRLRRPPHPGWDGTFLVASFHLHDYKVELIQPRPGRSGFAERFLARRGEGFHHLSIDVDRLDPYVAQLEADGVRVVDQQELRGGVKTAFISPRSAYGVLIQLWQPADFEREAGTGS